METCQRNCPFPPKTGEKIAREITHLNRPPHHDETHLGELFTLLQQKLAGRGPEGSQLVDDTVQLDLLAYTAQSISGIFLDPFDGKRYELRLRPADTGSDEL